MDDTNEIKEQATDTANNNTGGDNTIVESPKVWPVKRVYAAENLGEAILYVMENVGNIDKNSQIGDPSNKNSYKGIDDKDVKAAIGKAFLEAGLVILPVKVTPTTKTERYVNTYNKDAQHVHTEVITQYKLWHVPSNQWEILEGLGHGVDSQDKAAGKATTYALKYTLLYTFLVVTGKIDDADSTHSSEHPLPPASKPEPAPAASTDSRATLIPSDTENCKKALKLLHDNKGDIKNVRTFYKMSTKTEKLLLEELPKYIASLTPPAKEKPVLKAETPEYTKVINALIYGVDGSNYTIDDVKKKYTVSIKTEREISKEVEEKRIELAVKGFDKLKKVPLPNDTALAIEEATAIEQLDQLQEECTDLNNTMPFMLLIFNKRTELTKLTPSK